MTTWFKGDIVPPLSPAERDRRQSENDRMRVVWYQKHRPENIVVLPLSEVPPSYRHFLPKEDG